MKKKEFKSDLEIYFARQREARRKVMDEAFIEGNMDQHSNQERMISLLYSIEQDIQRILKNAE